MKSFTTSLWDNEELIKIFGKVDPDLHTRTTILLSYWISPTYHRHTDLISQLTLSLSSNFFLVNIDV